MSKLGKLSAEVLVDGGPEKKHYGPDDAINGRVMLSYESHTSLLSRKSQARDLFGPLKIQLKVHGRISLRVRHERELPTHHDIDLFQQSIDVFDGPLKATAGNRYSYPWSFRFPEDSLPVSSGTWIPTPTTALPPTFAMHFSSHPDIVKVGVEYLLEALVKIGGINVKTSVPRGDEWPVVLYDLPRPSRVLLNDSIGTFTDRASVRCFVADNSFGTSKKTFKVSDTALEDLPKSSINITCTNYQRVYPGQALIFRVNTSREESESTTAILSATSIEAFNAELIATTKVDAHERVIGAREVVDQRTLQIFAGPKTTAPKTRRINDSTIDVILPVVRAVESSFAHRKVSRSYKLRIEMQLKIANQLVRVNRDCPVTVVPAPADGTADSMASLSIQPPSWTASPGDAPPPAYEEIASNTVRSSGGGRGQDSIPSGDVKGDSKV